MGLEKLQKNIRQTLSDAQLIKTGLPLIPGVCLYLLDPVNLQRMFSAYETKQIVCNAPYWSFCWASGQALGAYIIQRKMVRRKKIIDFGSGSGVVAIASAKAGAERVIACDTDDHAIEAIRTNAELNQVNIETVHSLDDIKGKIDMIMTADVLYDSDNLPWLDLFHDYADEVLLADSRIKNIKHPRYRQIAKITAETVPDLQEGEEYNQVRIFKSS